MTITLVDDYILIESEAISAVIATPSNYTEIEITGNINCCTSNCEETVTTLVLANPFTSDPTKAELNADGLKIYPLFFGLTTFMDGVYRFEVKITPEEGGITYEQNCAFIDMTFKCKVASLLKYIIAENKTKGDTEKTSTLAHLLHYALFNGSNCGCNCAEMCVIFRELSSILDNIDPQILADCGC